MWFKIYLSSRSQVVKMRALSSNATLYYGVPQGSMLGPVLFLLYVNYMIKHEITEPFTLFTDDTTIL